MKKIIQESITLTDPKAIKIIEKVLPKKIIHCLNESPLTASEIAHAVSFPKDKIYYHIKNLLSYDILFVATSEIVRGIEQNKYSPVAKTINYNNIILQIGSDDNEKIDKLVGIQQHKLKEVHKIYKKETSTDKSLKSSQKEKLKSQSSNGGEYIGPLEDPKKPRLFQNALMHMNGATHSMTFVHTGNRVMFLNADLGLNRIIVKNIINYSLPIQKGKTTINTLTDLIISVFDQFVDQTDKDKIYLAIHSESYEYCMAYVDPHKINNYTRRNKTIKNISQILNIDAKENIIDYQTYNDNRNKSVICHSNSKVLIQQDYHKLIKAGIQPRYNTSIPKILFNFYNYCRDKGEDNGKVLLIYIDYTKTYLALVHNYCLVDSEEFTSGLNDFISELKALAPKTKQSLVSVRVKALDYLERYGIANSNEQPNKLNIFPWKKSKDAIQVLSNGIVSKMKISFSHFSKYIDKDKTPASMITKIYICGPGSHIRNLNELISSSIGKPVDHLSNFDSISVEKETIRESKSSPRKKDDGIIDKISESEENLEMVRCRIDHHKQEIDTVTSPENNGFRLTRLEMEKNSKFKKISKAQKELIHTATEFKRFRDNYNSTQEKLSFDLENTFNQLDELNSTLDQKSQEREYIIKTISNMEFDKDFIQGSVEIGKIENTKDETLKIKKLSYLRSKLMRDRELIEHEVINQEKAIIIIRQNNQDALLEVETIYDEIGVMEYLLQKIQNASTLFPKASLSELRLYHNLKQMDLDSLENAWAQFSFDVNRMEEIKNTLSERIYKYGSHKKNHPMNQNDEMEIKEILLPVIDELLDTSENMSQIKIIMATLVDMSDNQRDLVRKRISNESLLKEKKKLKDKQEQKLSKIQKVIADQTVLLKKEASQRDKELKAIDKTQEAINEIDELSKKDEDRKALQDERFDMEKELKSHKEQLDRLTEVIESKRKTIKALKPAISKERKESNKRIKGLGKKESRMLREEESLKIKIADQNKQNQDIFTQLEQIKREYDKMGKDLLDHKDKCLKLKDKEKLLQREANNEKKKLKSILNSELKRLDKEKQKNISDAENKRKIYYDSLMDSLNTLGKEEKFAQNQLKRQEKQIQTFMNQRNQLENSIQAKKKGKAPKITIWNKQIKKFEKDLKQYNRIQQNLYVLEYELRSWDQYVQDEKEKLDEKVDTIKDRIKYKKSDTYLQFLRQSAINFKSTEAAAKRMANSIARKNIKLDERELKTLVKKFDRIQKKYQNFVKSYKIRKMRISAEFRPFRGREKVIKNRIKNLKSKVADAEQIIQNLQEKLNNKNKQIDQSKSEYLKHQKEVQNKLNDLQLKIKRVLADESNAQEEVNAKLKIRFAAVAEQKTNAKNNYEMGIQTKNETLEYQDIIQKRIEHESLIQSGEIQLREFQDILHNLHVQQHGIAKSINHMEGNLEKTKNSIIRIKSQRDEKESRFNIRNEKLANKLSDNEKELEQNLVEHTKIKEANDKVEQELRIHIKAITQIENETGKIHKKVLTFTQKAQQLGFREKQDPIKKITDYDQHRLLLIDMDDDFNQALSMLDKNISGIEHSLALNRDLEVDENKSMSLIATEIKSMNNGLDDTLRLVANEQDSMNEIGDQYLAILDKFIRLNNLCQKTKRSIDVHVDVLYDTIDIKSKEEKKKNSKLSKMQEKMKNKKVDISMLEKELTSINQEIHDSLQDSIHFQQLAFETSQTLPHYLDPELQSYMDIADMKSRSKSLFDKIVTIEHQIERMQKKQNTIKNKLTMSEKINLKKIRLMEETCSKLEAQILSERSELELLEETLNDLKKYKSVYGDRIEILEKELQEFREKETEYELLLKDLDRSLKDIQSRSKQIIDKKANNTIENSIELDYMANLGLLLDPITGLNILPESHNKDFRYFAVNRVLRSVLLMLFATFLFTAYSLRVMTEPLNENLSQKLAVMADLNLKQDLKKKINLNNKVADKIQNIINQDKTLSNNMLLAMKYLSNTVPNNFEVTELVLDRDVMKYIDNIEESGNLGDTSKPAFIISMNGFYNQGLEKAESSMKSFKKILKRRNDFKTVIIDPGLVTNNWKTSFRILLAL